MKNYIIAVLIVLVFLLGSVIYRDSRGQLLTTFPVNANVQSQDNPIPLQLTLFFSKKNCLDCMQLITVLNNLKPPFVVRGVVPEEELADINNLRTRTQATFPIEPFKRHFDRLRPIMWPALYGISKKGWVLFVIPGIPGVEKHLNEFLQTFYIKAQGILMSE